LRLIKIFKVVGRQRGKKDRLSVRSKGIGDRKFKMIIELKRKNGEGRKGSWRWKMIEEVVRE
jgi:hypothetical protein